MVLDALAISVVRRAVEVPVLRARSRLAHAALAARELPIVVVPDAITVQDEGLESKPLVDRRS